MSASNATAELVITLNNAAATLNRFAPAFIFAFGTIGNILNIFVLSQRNLNSSPSALCFLLSSVSGLVALLSGLIGQTLSSYGYDLTATIGWICKVRSIFLYAARTLVLWLIALASADRWLSTHETVWLRRMSNMPNIKRGVAALLIYTCLLNGPILYCFDANQVQPPRPCYASVYICRLTTALLYSFGTTIFPLLLMFVFGLMTISNIRHLKHRIRNDGNSISNNANIREVSVQNRQHRTKRLDRHLLKMLFVQIVLLILFTFPHSIQRMYWTFVPDPPPQSLQNAIETLIFNSFILLTFIASGMPFYIYTLTGGSIFRRAILDVLQAPIIKIQNILHL